MPISVTCPQCGLKANAPDQAAGKKLRCKCGGTILIAPKTTGGSPSQNNPDEDRSRSDQVRSEKNGREKTKKEQGSSSNEPLPEPIASSLLDLLKESDQELAQSNPYAVTEKSSNSDAAALRTYLKDDEEKKAKAKQSQGNLLAITVCFFIGVIKNVALIVIALAFSQDLPQAAWFAPLIPVGAVYLTVLIPYSLFDLGAGIGMLKKKAWGWWMALLGLGWGIVERIASFVVVCMTNDEFNGPLFAGIASLVLCGVSFALIHFLLQKESQKRFQVDVKPAMAWLIVLLVPLLIEGTIMAAFYWALKNAMANPGV